MPGPAGHLLIPMKRFVILLSSLLLMGGNAFAQEETPAKYKLYGFVRNYMVMDTRAVKGGTHDLYYYMPEDIKLNAAGEDANEGLNWKFVSLTTRLGLDFSGYQFGSMHVSGKVEADFYSLNGSAASNTIAQFRLRQAYMALKWNLAEDENLTLNLGQAWHPMGVDLPNCINLESGAPFGPFNRSPQAMLHWNVKDWTFTGGILYLSQYLPMDAEAAGKSVSPFKYGFPEAYAGLGYKHGPVAFKTGFSLLNTKPVRTFNDAKANGLMTSVTGFLYGQYTKGLFQLKAKTALAQSGEHLNILSGYGISAYDASSNTFTYTPMQDWTSFVSFQYGKKFQVMGMVGYMKQLGTTRDLMDGVAVLNKTAKEGGNLWINTAASATIQQAFRVTPTLAWNLGKFTVALEYDLTTAEFGDSDAARGVRGLYEAGHTHWVTNHRVLCMTKFNF